MAKGGGEGLMLMLEAEPPSKRGGGGGEGGGALDVEESFDEYPEDMAEMSALDSDEPSPAFTTYAESALGTTDPDKVSALREAIREIVSETGGM